jgi:putative FmdB family regulatory protein
MPIFEYACQDCGHGFEQLVRHDSVPACPQCRSHALEKKLSVFATASTGASAGAQMAEPVFAGPCGSCGHPDGPGACRFND